MKITRLLADDVLLASATALLESTYASPRLPTIRAGTNDSLVACMYGLFEQAFYKR